MGNWNMGFFFYLLYFITLPMRLLIITIPSRVIGIFSKDKAIDYVLKNDWLDRWLGL